MKKDDLIRKFTSRKFWLAVASFVSMLMIALGRSESDATQVASLIMAGSSIVAYVVAEGLADAGHKDDIIIEDLSDE